MDPLNWINLSHSIIANPHYLSLDLYLENGANDGQCVADDDQDIPTIHKLQLV